MKMIHQPLISHLHVFHSFFWLSKFTSHLHAIDHYRRRGLSMMKEENKGHGKENGTQKLEVSCENRLILILPNE